MLFDVPQPKIALHAEQAPDVSGRVIVVDAHLRLASFPKLGVTDFAASRRPDQEVIKLGTG